MFGQKATLGLGVMLSCDGFESDSDSFNAAVLTAREQSWLSAHVMGWILSPKSSYVEVLTPSTSECDCI